MGGGKKTVSGSDQRVELAPFNPIGSHTQNTSLDVLVTLTPPNTVPRATKLLVQAIDQNIRFTIDGAAPTPTFGFRLTAGDPVVMLTIGPNTVLQFTEEAAGSTLEYCWGQ